MKTLHYTRNSIMLTATALLLSGIPALAQFKIQAHFPEAKNKEVQLLGYSGLKDTLLAKATTDASGKFILQYPKSYTGAALLQVREANSLIVLLNKENYSIDWPNTEDFGTLKFKNSGENDAFNEGIALYQESEGKLAGLKYLRPLYEESAKKQAAPVTDAKKLEWLQEEISFQENRLPHFLASLGKDRYVKSYMQIRKLIQDMPLTASRYNERRAAHEKEFLSMDFTAPALLRSGLYKEVLEGYYMLLENNDGNTYEPMNRTTDAVLAGLNKNPQLKQEVAEHLFKYLEKRSLFKAAEHLALAMLDDSNCQIEDSRAALFEQYRKMALGNTAPDVELVNSKSGIHRLSDIKSQYKLVVFGASWCHTCATEIPKLKATYDKWKQQDGMEIVLVSLDNDKASYETFVKDFPWISTSDFKGWDSKAARDYFVFATPTMFLLDSQNKILLKPISPEQITAWLDVMRASKE